ncbi:MAG: NERD domain-containing protein [Proteobacteria bacterium]|nr:NERD domain-containing protein [Pseudomonadota bacterium]MBU1389326.1 NERD domain-containing protein [Pseudomonadota bacterium]MBU1544146.1 NERD domain-containing protein [Pseudomonadota bacterium]MBU2429558.1 NERD domain-containing protein [Pseudomonadota bacterium]MBU2482717.1 NERD domain-containing protein [Pseudomonadota bacterium]
MEILFVLTIVAFLVFQVTSKSPKYKGKVGEKKVVGKLGKLIKKLDGVRIFHNVTVKTPDGSTQIDHLILSTSGIFVIETKNMSGWIFGDERQKKWTQTIYRKKTKFQNPIHQNYKHVKALQNLLSVDLQFIFNIVVFVGDAKFKTRMPDNVVKIRGLLPYIRSHNQSLLSAKDVDRCASLIINANIGNAVSDKQHVENVKNNRKNPLCPKCGAPMVLRTAHKGGNKGSRFWGCSNFPACNGIRNAS